MNSEGVKYTKTLPTSIGQELQRKSIVVKSFENRTLEYS